MGEYKRLQYSKLIFWKKCLTNLKKSIIIAKRPKNGRLIYEIDKVIYKEVGIKMSTYMAKANEIEKKWYIIDAAGKPLGRVAATAATILRGKHRPQYTPGVDCGEFVIVINAKDAVLTGNKLLQKKWYRHTGYIGHLKEVSYKTLMETRPEKAMELAIAGMLPHNTLGRKAMKKLRVYKDANHNHEAQTPVVWEQA